MKEDTSAKIPEKDSTQKAQTENYEQIKYKIEGKSGGQEKHQAEKVCEIDYKKLEGVGKRARKPKSHHYHKTYDGD